jgi:hypothetical protein
VHHIAFNVSRAVYTQVAQRLDERGIPHTPEIDRGFMHSIYFRDPLGLRLELACYKFEPPVGFTHAQVLLEAHQLRVAQGAYNIQDAHLAEAIERLVRRSQRSLSEEREARHGYPREVTGP